MPPEAAQLRLWRLGIAAWLALDAVLIAAMTSSEGGLHSAWLDAPNTLGAVATRPWLVWLLAAMAVAGAFDFGRRRDAIAGGLVYLAAMATLDLAFGAAHGTFGGRFYFSALLLTGWLIGRLGARATGLDPRRSPAERLEVERFAALAALALLSTAYVNACVSKLASPDLSWRHTDHLRLILLSRMALDGSLVHTLQAFLIDHPTAIRGLNLLTLILEGGAPLILLGARVRMVWATLLIAFHLGIYMTMGLFWGSAIYFMLLLGYPWHRLPWLRARLEAAEPPPAGAPIPPPAGHGRRTLALLAGLCALLIAVWVLPIERRLDPVARAGAERSDRGLYLGARVERLGPLREGLGLSPGWRIDGLYVERDVVHAELHGGEDDRVTVGMGPLSAAKDGSFLDVGDLALWHLPTETPDSRFGPAVQALASHLQRLAPAGGSVAAALQAVVNGAGLPLDFHLDRGSP